MDFKLTPYEAEMLFLFKSFKTVHQALLIMKDSELEAMALAEAKLSAKIEFCETYNVVINEARKQRDLILFGKIE